MSRNALIVGINTYHHLKSLKSPAEDAEAVAPILEQYGNFHVTRLPVVRDENNPSGRMSRKAPISHEQLEDALLRLFAPDGRNIPDTVLFFLCGHGLRRNRRMYQEGYLAVSDADQKERWGISLPWLRRLLENRACPVSAGGFRIKGFGKKYLSRRPPGNEFPGWYASSLRDFLFFPCP